MTEEKKDINTNTPETDYLAAIQELKANSVNRDEYEKVREDNKKLLDAIVNGGNAPVQEEVQKLREPEEIRKELFSGEPMGNLDYSKKTLELRDSLLSRGENDPFLPSGTHIAPTQEDIAAAQRVADVLAQTVEYADGDNDVFTNELQRRTLDVRIR